MKIVSPLLSAVAALCLLTGSATAGDAEWITLFDGESMDGWKVNENPDTWTIQDGALVCKGDRSHLFYVGDAAPFKNFVFQADVMTKPGSNAGIYIHTKYQDQGWPRWGYEVQVNNTHRDPRKTASIYAVKDVTKAPAKDNEFFTMWIKVVDKTVTVKVNGKVVNEFTQPDDQKAFSKQFDRMFGEGTFALQGHDPKSEVHFKNLKVKKLP